MATKYYTIIFRDGGTPKTALTPTVDVFRDVATNTALSVPSVTELTGGLYKFPLDWDLVDEDVTQIALRIDSGDGAMADADRYVFGMIERNDVLDVYQLNNAMVLGNWTIEDNQLKIFLEEDTVTPFKTFDLTDINGDPTSLSATTRTGV